MQVFRKAIVLAFALSLAAPAAYGQEPAQAQNDGPRQVEVTILGMSCPFCAYGVEQKLKKLDGVTELEVVLETGLATLRLEEDADISNALLRKTVKDAGFDVAKISRSYESDFPDYEPGSGDNRERTSGGAIPAGT
ncbi:MAG: heavy-metal-associated domain-containing protein [Longimicrobiales bacterium]